MRAVPAGPRGGGRQGRESQPPGPAEAARPWEMACASGRKSSGRRNLGRDSHGGDWSEPSGPAVLARSVPSALRVSRSSAPSPRPHPGSADRCFSALLCHHPSQRDEPNNLAGVSGMRGMWMGLVCFLPEAHVFRDPFSTGVAPLLN